MTPRVAVIIPCYNDGATLGETLASLNGAEPVELVVVDDGSTDPATLATLSRLRADGTHVHRQHNAGLPAARMAGVAQTTAPFVYPLDADDLAVPGSITIMADLLEASPAAAACAGDYEEFGERSVLRNVPELDPYRVALVNEYPVSALYRRSVLIELGGWRGFGGVWYEDWDLWMTIAEAGHRTVHPGPGVVTYRRRSHGSHGPRMLADVKREHQRVYRHMRALHPDLFARLPEHKRNSSLGRRRKLLYPLLYGDRKRLAFEPALRRVLDRARLWQLGR